MVNSRKFGSDPHFQNMRLSVSQRACRAVKLLEVLPHRLWAQRKAKIARLNGVPRIKIEISRGSQLAQILKFLTLKRAVKIIGMQNPDQNCPLMTLL